MSTLANKPRVLLFDVNETLLNIAPLKDKVAEVLLDPDAPELWFTTMLQYSLAATVSGNTSRFRILARPSCGCSRATAT